jgi:hypothetical protein
MSHDLEHNMRERVIKEVKLFAVMIVYLWVLFELFTLYEFIILRKRGIYFSPQEGFALINALVFGKVMLVALDLGLGHRIRRHPLIFPILFETFLLIVICIGAYIVEHLVVGLFKRETLASSIPAIGGGGLLGYVCVAVIFFIEMLPYFAFRNVSRELGPGRLNAMLFGTKVPDDGPKKRT